MLEFGAHGGVLLLFGRCKISELPGDVAPGIKAFKKGMNEDDTARVEPVKPKPVKTINHQSAQTVGQQTENRKVRRAPDADLHGIPAKRGALPPLGVRMLDIGWSKLVLISVVVLIVIGPKELPGVLRAVGQWTGKIRRMAAEFQGQFQEAMREAEMADLNKQVEAINDAARSIARFDPLTDDSNKAASSSPTAAGVCETAPELASPASAEPQAAAAAGEVGSGNRPA